MVSAAPGSAWNPAMMPNSIADLQDEEEEEEEEKEEEKECRSAKNAPLPDTASDGGAGAWFEDDVTGDDWLAETTNAPVPVPAPTTAPASEPSVEDPVPSESNTASKHFSTMSFTRTVSHEVNWNDDDDADSEWTLSRAGTDPSKYMPDSALRTNSFPLISPVEDESIHQTHHEPEHPIAFNQAEEMIRELEEEDEEGSEDDEPLPDATTTNAWQPDSDAQDTANGSFFNQDTTNKFNPDDAMEARFEEGMPLVPSAAPEAAQQQDSAKNERDLFSEDAAGDEDDFFSNARPEETAHQDDFLPQPLERKSTLDVLKAMDMAPARPGFVPLEETAEESETEEEMPQPPQDTDGLPAQSSDSLPAKAEPAEGQNLDSKWQEMFGEDDDAEFLPDEGTEAKEVDASAFLGSDDEGLLEDSETEEPEPTKPLATPAYAPAAVPSTQPSGGKYLPPTQTPSAPAPSANPYLPAAVSPATPTNPYLPAAPLALVQPPVAAPCAPPPAAAPAPAQYGYGAAPPPVQEKSKAQSFVDKNKGGYTSPYDLPMEVVKPPKRRASAQPLQSSTVGPASSAVAPPPLRSASAYAQPPPPPSGALAPGMPRPVSSHAPQGPPSARKLSQEGFFEELPMTTKPPRSSSRQSQRGAPSPTHPSPYGLPPLSAPASVTSHPIPPPAGPPAPTRSEAGIPDLVAPPRVNPYASLSTTPGLQPAVSVVASTRYSPAPPAASLAAGAVPVPAASRYSPAPPASRQPSVGYGPVPTTPGPPILPHQPRTSSPLAHFEITNERSRAHVPLSNGEGGHSERRSSSSYHEPRLQRIPSLPPTREVEEDDPVAQGQSSPGAPMAQQPMSPPVSRYAPPPQGARHTPPPMAHPGQAALSPPKRVMSSHSPLAPPYDFTPPPRSQTQSPGQLYGNRGVKPSEPIPRPSSVNGPASPSAPMYPPAMVPLAPAPAPAPAPVQAGPAPAANYGRPRGASLNLNVIPPTDGREHDPLQRWRGTPLVSWGVGGTLVTMFPKEVPRYGINSAMPTVVRSPGEVKIQNIKDITPLEERLAKFPGPLKGKSKKKETLAWLTTGIEGLERGLPTNAFLHPHLSHEDKRAGERVLLWKILRIFVEHDGVLEGNPAVENAVRDILSPGLEAPDGAAPYLNGATAFGAGNLPAGGLQSDGVSSSTVEQIRRLLLSGEREKAVWAAVDQRLWGHALLLSGALAPELYKQVAQEFIKKEVNAPGHSNEPLAALYGVLSGNHEESVDELVPSHARAGFQLVAANSASGPSKDATEGLDKWRETLSLILSNRSAEDARAINSLGVLLSGYGRAEAAHICFMFARSHTVFGGLDDAASHFVLVGSDHKKQAEQFAKEIEPLLLSEVYEYGQSLAGGSNVLITNPHLAAYKLQHALALAEYGFRDKALQYCDAIAAAITAQTKRSPYHHPILENAVEDLMARLKQAPKEESNSWIPKPSMNKVSDTVWSKFNKFVSGDEDGAGQGPSGEAETGPFSRVAGDTPTISRSPSVSNMEIFGAAVPSYGIPPPLPNGVPVPLSAPPTRAASRYAPGAAAQPAATGSRPSTSAYAPRSSMERTSSELTRGGSFELPRRSLEMQSGRAGTYSPVRSGSPAAMYTPHSADFNAPQQSPYSQGSQPGWAPPRAPASAPPQQVGYPGAPINGVSPVESEAPGFVPAPSSYQPPSYGYEPPAFTPYEPPAEDNNNNAASSDEVPTTSSYEAPSYQPYSYEPPSYEPDQPANDEGDSGEEPKPKPKKKGIMYDDEDDDLLTPRPAAQQKTKADKDRENDEMFRKAAEEDAKRAEEAKQAKKGWGFTSWFGGKKDASSPVNGGSAQSASAPNKPIRAKLGEANSFYYDPELKRWVNKNAGPEEAAKKPAPPPPRAAAGAPRSVSASPGPPPTAGGPDPGRASAPPTGPPRAASFGPLSTPSASASDTSLPGLAPPPPPAPAGPVAMLRSVSNTSTASAPSLGGGGRPGTSLSNSSSIDDLLGAAGGMPRKAGAKKGKRGARYIDVMGK
ncbi:Sec23-binding domain of Sec16-domain-containing protein [Staphylotrichum tortipilum]|uniref:Protein transport protein sec16 n=1 Tax=Staphylotrichum tortipilum TaxID=2831512 RepID=A0AAN6MKF0_9PEZI|nr:Sec23-binding domain of Sec16-domain-containing protein [Staphylotrichum longicolle]